MAPVFHHLQNINKTQISSKYEATTCFFAVYVYFTGSCFTQESKQDQ